MHLLVIYDQSHRSVQVGLKIDSIFRENQVIDIFETLLQSLFIFKEKLQDLKSKLHFLKVSFKSHNIKETLRQLHINEVKQKAVQWWHIEDTSHQNINACWSVCVSGRIGWVGTEINKINIGSILSTVTQKKPEEKEGHK